MAIETTNFSLRDSLKARIAEFLLEEGFENADKLKIGLLEIVNAIADYREEGNALFPEVLITSNPELLKTIPHKRLRICDVDISEQSFRVALKLCAPLASDGWLICLELTNDNMGISLATAEISPTSPSMYSQAVGQIVDGDSVGPVALVRNIGTRTVELVGNKSRIEISLTLTTQEQRGFNEVELLAEAASSRCEDALRVPVRTFLAKVIDDALKCGHGNLIAVVEDDEEKIKILMDRIDSRAGVYLPEPIDFANLVYESEALANSEGSAGLRSFASVFIAMLNSDGVTVITDRGRVLAYHLLVRTQGAEGEQAEGGARTKAFNTMTELGLFVACLFKSQDGRIKIWQTQ